MEIDGSSSIGFSLHGLIGSSTRFLLNMRKLYKPFGIMLETLNSSSVHLQIKREDIQIPELKMFKDMVLIEYNCRFVH
jgi:hypothetical protein